jgi:hypothetical protein
MPASCASWPAQPLLFRFVVTVTFSTLIRPFHPP